MALKSYSVSVPGSLILFGEHAVLQNKTAIVAAINKYLTINLTPRTDNRIKIISAEFGEYHTTLQEFKITKTYNYVLTAINQYLKKTTCGFTLNITSDFSSTIGFGSSTAVTVATLGVLTLWHEKKSPNLMHLYRQAVKVIHTINGVGSGADVAASVFGGIISYQTNPVKIKKINTKLPLTTIYSGHKTPTIEVINVVAKKQVQFPMLFIQLYNTINCCTKMAIEAIKNRNWSRLGKLMNMHQGLQDALGVNNSTLSELIFSLRTKHKIYGAKISGAGLGDCIIGLGKIPANTFPENIRQKKLGIKQIEVAISKTGFRCL